MLTIFTNVSSTSSRRAVQFLNDFGIEFVERNATKDPMNVDEFKDILQNCTHGTDDIISLRSKAAKEFGINEDTTISELFKAVEAERTIMKYPILFDGTKLQIGFNDDAYRKFLPKSYRRKELERMIGLCDAM